MTCCGIAHLEQETLRQAAETAGRFVEDAETGLLAVSRRTSPIPASGSKIPPVSDDIPERLDYV